MDSLSFDSDYMRGCHPEIMEMLCHTNMDASTGYGSDRYTAEAKSLIANACGFDHDKCLIEFLVGGTQTNSIVISSLLHSYQGVIAADTGHINVHEAGAIEAGGHKVITLPSHNGKLQAKEIARYVDEFYADETYSHMVAPGMVYISHPTELGTLYTLSELEEISAVCRRRDIKLYLDGARLAYGLHARSTDVTLPDIARLTDIFYIGGTKCGALFGEAVVAADKNLIPHFPTIIKQHGALLAKGRLLGVQFATLFKNDLYDRICRHGISTAMEMRKIFLDAGFELYIDSPTNQQFFILPNDIIDRLMAAGVGFELWGPRQKDKTPVRFVTDWATTMDSLQTLSHILSSVIP